MRTEPLSVSLGREDVVEKALKSVIGNWSRFRSHNGLGSKGVVCRIIRNQLFRRDTGTG